MVGRPCDGCQLPEGDFDEEKEYCGGYEGELEVCPDCDYAVCDDCACHACTASQPCFGVGRCRCGSCNSELQRQLNPSEPVGWQCRMLPPFASAGRPKWGDLNVHHNLSRGTCKCPFSNFGKPYLFTGEGCCYQGARGGAKYSGPWMSRAQQDRENDLLRRDLPWLPLAERKCELWGCDKADAALRCGRCKSAWYCSKEHQREAWQRDPTCAWRAHKDHCGAYVPPAKWPYLSEEVKAYEKSHGHRPTHHFFTPSISPLAALSLATLRLADPDNPLLQGAADAQEVAQRCATSSSS